jgi:adenylate cyclase class IV
MQFRLDNCIGFIVETSRPTSVMSTSSSIEAIEDDDEGWEIIEKPKLNQSKLDNSKTPTIEVERKFIVPTNYHERLIANGFKLQMEFDEILVDKYYDTPEHALLNDDHWLRQRNGDWELKYPVGSGHSGGTTLYHETTCHEDILSKLTPILALEDFSLQQVLDSGKLDTFAHLETKRKCYSKDDVNIVIDATDWGHSIGEIEVMVTDHSQVGEASKRIELLGLQLGKSIHF